MSIHTHAYTWTHTHVYHIHPDIYMHVCTCTCKNEILTTETEWDLISDSQLKWPFHLAKDWNVGTDCMISYTSQELLMPTPPPFLLVPHKEQTEERILCGVRMTFFQIIGPSRLPVSSGQFAGPLWVMGSLFWEGPCSAVIWILGHLQSLCARKTDSQCLGGK